ncbi:MAG: hypothetical protein ACT4PL_01185, partial [Phycisphaerales bacterium]
MSAKWIRSRQWDDEFFPRWAAPAKWLLRTFSSIWLSVLLLSLVATYGILASIPIGMLAAIPSYLALFAAVILAVTLTAGLASWGVHRALRNFGLPVRFVATFAVFVPIAIIVCVALYRFGIAQGILEVTVTAQLAPAWKFFPEFCQEYRATTLRRLPGMEMSEMEFYAWWPLRIILLCFVANLTTATLRRIEFKFVNLGVLTVHTGIITIAIGSVYYAALKQEGDLRLRIGDRMGADGRPEPGQEEAGFFSREQPALWITQSGKDGWDQQRMPGLPRYNEYNMGAVSTGSFAREFAAEQAAYDHGRTLDLTPFSRLARPLVDPDISIRIVGYAPYCDLRDVTLPLDAVPAGTPPSPLRMIDVIDAETEQVPPRQPGPPTPGIDPFLLAQGEEIVGAMPMLATRPAGRIALPEPGIEIEYTTEMDPGRFEALATPLPKGTKHGLLVEVPALNFKQAFPVTAGQSIEVTPGGYTIEVEQILPQPPFPIITKGYENAPSSVAIVRITPPKSAADGRTTPFTRYCYSRFPEIAQDLLDEKNDRGMPKRVAPDAAIRITHIDADGVRMYFDEQPSRAGSFPGRSPADPPVRLLMRIGEQNVQVFENLATGSRVQVLPDRYFRLGRRYPAVEAVRVPQVVAEENRQREGIGTHKKAAIAVRLSAPGRSQGERFEKIFWLSHGEYFPIEESTDVGKTVALPDGRVVTIGFGRAYFPFPDLGLRFADFEMTPFPHSDVPRDYRSDLIVLRKQDDGTLAQERASTSMNNPLLLTVPFRPSPDRSAAANTLGRLVSFIAPNGYKISQVGWDPQTWFKTKAAAERGEIDRPFAGFTILGVGNNPGIYVVAAGAIMMGAGIP